MQAAWNARASQEPAGCSRTRWVWRNAPRSITWCSRCSPKGMDRRQTQPQALEAMRLFDLDYAADRRFSELSGGEAQRLMLARAVCSRPDMLLVDEPTAQLDTRTAHSVSHVLGNLANQGMIVLVATHDPDTRDACARNRSGLLCARGGRGRVGMGLRSIFSEAIRNIGSGTAHALALFLVVLLGGVLLGGYEAYTVVAMECESLTRVRAVADVDSVIGGTVDGSACDRLTRTTDGAITQAGAMRAGGEITALSTPNNALQSYEVTPGMLSLVASNGTTTDSIDMSGIWVPTEVARDFGWTIGSTLSTSHGEAMVAGIYSWPNDGRDTRFAYTFLVPRAASQGTYNECWVRQWPRSGAASNLLYSTLGVGEGSGQAGVTSLDKGFDSHYDPYATYMGRVTHWIPYLSILIGVVIGVLAVRVRRLEYAAALHSGSRSRRCCSASARRCSSGPDWEH